MTSRDQPTDPGEPTEAEAAYLAERRTVRIAPGGRGAAGGAVEPDDPDGAEHPTTVLPDQRTTVRLPGPPHPRRPPLVLAAAVAAASAAVVTFVPVALIVLLLHAVEAGELAVAEPLRLSAAGWLLTHGVPLQASQGAVGLLPLALTALAGWRLARAGVHVARATGARRSGSWRQALRASGAVAAAYGLLGLLAAALAAGDGWWADLVRAGATMAGVGFAAASYGSLRSTGVLAVQVVRLPVLVRDSVRTGAVAALLVLAAGAALAGTAVAVAGGGAADTLAAYRTGVAGHAGLTLVCLAYAPTLAAWGAAYLLGPGFAVGADTVVRSSEVGLGPLPALPVLAGLPNGPLPEVGAALLVCVTGFGAVAGWLLGRRWDLRPAWSGLLGRALLAGPVAGLLLGLVAALAAGPVGGGHLSTLGPVPWQVAAFGAALTTPGVVLGVAAGVWFTRRR